MNSLKNYLFFALATFVFGPPLQATVDEDVAEILLKGTRPDFWETAKPKKKAALVDKLRQIMLDRSDRDRNYNHQINARVALLHLGDSVAVQDTMRLFGTNYFQRRRMLDLMKKSTQLALIPLIAPELAHDNPQAVMVARTICQILVHSTEVSPEIKNWAGRFTGQQAEAPLVLVKAFWANNADAFSAKQYGRISIP